MKRAIRLVVILLAWGRVAGAGERAGVMVLPFEAAQADKQWVGKAMQQTLVAELSAVPTLTGRAGAKAAGSPDEAVSLAREGGAKHVIYGDVQGANGELRITGVVMEVASGQPSGILRATGAARDLFALQDQITAQAKGVLGVGVAAEVGEAVVAPQAPATATAPVTQPATTRYATRVERSVANIEQGSDQIRRLEDEIDRLKDRIRSLEREDNLPPVVSRPSYDDYYDFYPYHYYSPALFYSVPIHGRHPHISHHHHFGSGIKAHGSFRGSHFSGTFRMGAGGHRR